MKNKSALPLNEPPSNPSIRKRLFRLPSAPIGWWAAWLGALFLVFWTINTFVFMPSNVHVTWRQIVLPFYGIFMILCGLAAGIIGLIAVIRQHERSLLVWFALLPGLLVIFLLLGEFLVPH
jgi:hypothetical protein